MTERTKCVVEDGLFVRPCASLEGAVDNRAPSFSKVKGVAHWALANVKTHKPSRDYFGLKSKKHPNGFLFNFCPWCGGDISAPFRSEDNDQ